MRSLAPKLCVAAIVAISLGACESLDPGLITTGANPNIADQEKFSKVDLIALLDPLQIARRKIVKAGVIDDPNDPTAPKTNPGADLIENAFVGFRHPAYDTGQYESILLRRNRVQDRLVSASEIRCADFKKDVHRFKGDLNFISKAVATALSTAGGLAGGMASQILSGTSAGVLGIGTAADEAYLNALTLSVIVKAIDDKRAEILTDIRAKQKMSFSNYSVEAAVSDALAYHQSCSLLAGLTKADETVSESKKDAENNLRTVTITSIFGEDEATPVIESFLGWNGTNFTDTPHVTAVRTWLDTNDLQGLSLTLFLNGGVYAADREKFLRDFNLKN